MSPGPHYDDIVVGSSPLMLLQALKLSASGRRVCVVERLARVGGVWRTAPLGLHDEVEIACHLVEDFPGVYRYLEKVSGIPFIKLDDQPIRVLKNGRVFRYSSRTTLILGALWAVAQLGRYYARRKMGRQTDEDTERSHALTRKVADFFSYHLPIALRGSTIKAPEQGFAAFVSALQQRCRDSDIRFVQSDVSSIHRTEQGSWCLAGNEGTCLKANQVHCTTSANLRSTDPGRFESVAASEAMSRSLVVEIQLSALLNRVSYAAFWNDPDVVRISRIDRPSSQRTGLLYLLQLRRGVSIDADRLRDVVQTALRRARVIDPAATAGIVGDLECSYVPHRRQLPEGEIQPGFYGYSSAGNLASGVARWLTGP